MTDDTHAASTRRRRWARWGAAGAALGAAALAARRRGPRPEVAYPPIGRFVEVEGVRLHLVEKGPADAPAVALIHGASGNVRDFAFGFMDRLAPRYRVVALDRPGFGHSQRGPGGRALPDAHSPHVQARLLRGALRAVGIERAIWVGHSLAGATVLANAVDAPESAAAVVTLGGVTHPWPGTAGYLYDIGASVAGGVALNAVRLLATEATVLRDIDQIFRPQSAPPGYAAYVGAALALRPETLRWNAEDIARLKPIMAALRVHYAGLRPPIEILHGAEDTIVPLKTHGRRLDAECPGARLNVLPSIGHMPHHAAPDACVAAIDRAAARAGLGPDRGDATGA